MVIELTRGRGVRSPLSKLCFFFVVAQVFNNTATTAGLTRNAGVTAMQNQPVVSILKKWFRHMAKQFLLDLNDVFPFGDAGSVRDAKDVGVHGHGGLTKRCVEDHIGRFSADPRQGF